MFVYTIYLKLWNLLVAKIGMKEIGGTFWFVVIQLENIEQLSYIAVSWLGGVCVIFHICDLILSLDSWMQEMNFQIINLWNSHTG